ncbi:hypothetical protein IWW38_000924 [Coemansia aciculifera]|uniref:Uncharacterized protein n=1 Tax=Coemansia aciculifera TaxID=417176 RepID=A0ACC1M9K3_9FUNG|nr:hypothetical protein IWW38_000924 [Coemansia aciculifera]
MNAQQAYTDSFLAMNGFGSGYHAAQYQQQQQQRQRQADDDLAALNEFLTVSSAVASAQHSRQPVVSVDDQTMATILSSAPGAYTDQHTLVMSGGPTSPLTLASIGVTPSQSLQAMSAEAAASFANAQTGNYMLPANAASTTSATTELSRSLFSQPLSGLDAASLSAILGSADHSPYTASSNGGGLLEVPTITEQPPSEDFAVTPRGSYSQMGLTLGKRKAVEFDDGPVNTIMGVPLSKRVSMPAFVCDRSTNAMDNSFMPIPTGVGMQRIATYHPGGISAASFSPDLLNPFSILSGTSDTMLPSAVSPSNALPVSRFNSAMSATSNSGAGMGLSPQGVSVASLSPSSQQSETRSAPLQQRKVAHNAIERRYRNNINDRIGDLRNAVPALQHVHSKKKTAHGRRGSNSHIDSSDDEEDYEGGDDGNANSEDDPTNVNVDGVAAATKLNKATILGKSTEYIYYLRRSNDQLKRESLYLQELIRNSFPGGGSDNIIASMLERARQESAAATAALYPPEKPARPSKRK